MIFDYTGNVLTVKVGGDEMLRMQEYVARWECTRCPEKARTFGNEWDGDTDGLVIPEGWVVTVERCGESKRVIDVLCPACVSKRSREWW